MNDSTRSLITYAAAAIEKKRNGEHFSDTECKAAVSILEAVECFAIKAELHPLGFWAASELSFFRGIARNRGLKN